MLDPVALDRWCREVFGVGVAAQLFSSGHLAAVAGLELDDGRRIVVKVRPASERLRAVVATHQHLHQAGVPCPRPLVGPLPFDGQAITAETYVPGDPPPDRGPAPDTSAELLALVVEAAPPASAASALDPAPPWVCWDHRGEATWPPPDDLDIDLNRVADHAWIDEAGRLVRRALRAHAANAVVGHVDWEAQNLGWRGDHAVVIYDWDSLAVRPEPTVAGAAAAVFTASGGTKVAASLDETAAFLDSYQRVRGAFEDDGPRAAWAAGLWTLLYNAKKETAGGGRGYLRHLGAELEERMRRAGL